MISFRPYNRYIKYEGLDQGSANSDQVRPPWEVIASDESDSETDVDNLEQTDSASCQLVGSVNGSDDTRTSAQAQGGGLTPNTAEIGLVAKDGTKWEYIEFSSGSRDGPLSAFELLVNNAMLIHVQQCTEAEAHRVKNSDE
ncbi:unnamed protein product [Clavelina lepadiformis]|uniref:Uncharacterized protein n=1 Tax=Clavelina lepadiformis TaxID=159417 RepID=A0ABP0FMJ4_CLALP